MIWFLKKKNDNIIYNFEKDPIDAFIDNEWVKAKDTTLGADNGIGIAAIMVLLESKDIEHPAIEVLLTTDEESGMIGALKLKPELLKGDILFNLDSEEEGEFCIGCAGGIKVNATLDYKEDDSDTKLLPFKVSLTGLKGGHSGVDIHLGRGNSIKLLVRFLKYAIKKFNIKIAEFEGGTLQNAIPREAFSTFLIEKEKQSELQDFVKEFESVIKSELSETEPDLNLSLESTQMPKTTISNESQDKIINSLYICPNGILRMSNTTEVVETSNNLAIVKVNNSVMQVTCSVRSLIDSARDDLAEVISSVFELIGSEVISTGVYPGWKPNANSEILDVVKTVYKNRFGKLPKIYVIHAGLECGVLRSVYPKLDAISFGPTIKFPHSPDEKVNIKSVVKFWDFLIAVLKSVPTC